MALSRQNLPVLDPEKYKVAEGVRKGAYILQDGGASPDVLMVAAGAEVWPVLQAAADLKKEGISARVVSMPSFRIFEEQPDAYKQHIFPDHLPKLAVEAGAPMCWWKYVGRHGDVIGLERFGASSPGRQSAGRTRLQSGQHHQTGQAIAGAGTACRNGGQGLSSVLTTNQMGSPTSRMNLRARCAVTLPVRRLKASSPPVRETQTWQRSAQFFGMWAAFC